MILWFGFSNIYNCFDEQWESLGSFLCLAQISIAIGLLYAVCVSCFFLFLKTFGSC